MSIVISIYSRTAFKEYLLPSLNNADYSILLEKDYFQLHDDLSLKLEVMDEKWKIKQDHYYRVSTKESKNYAGHVLGHKDVILVENRHKEQLTMFIKEVESVFHAYDKFSLNNVECISIGKEAGNDIAYDFMNTVSKEHAVITKKNGSFYVENKSPNGIYVNSVKVEQEVKLSFGDYINIMGLHMIYLGNILAIDTKEKQIKINQNKLKAYVEMEEGTVLLSAGLGESQGKTIYHRAPRNYEFLEEDVIEIEEPPERQATKQQSAFMTLGPAITMVLPMLLGGMLMLYSSNSSGGTANLSMYSGLVMSVMSAAIGVFWSVTNGRAQKKEEAAKEQHRINAYGQYLIDKTEEIKTKYENTSKMLLEMYPSPESCLKYDEKSGVLWNRNKNHEDFLTHRLGIGDIPFQVGIEVPKKRFRLYEDDLAQKPAFIKDNYEKLYQVPVTMDFTEHNLIGLVGGANKAGAYQVAQAMSAQIAANNCYTDVKLGYIFDGSSSLEKAAWDFAKWMPHTWSEDKKTRFIASNKEEASDVFYELTKIFRNRTEEKQDPTKQGEEKKAKADEKVIPKPYYIIFVSNPSLLEGELFAKYVFEKDNDYGLTTVLLAKRYEELPNSCEFIIQNDDKFQGMYDVYDRDEQKVKIAFDTVDKENLTNFTAKLSGLQVLEMEEGGEIPNSITFFEMFGANKLEDIPVKELWAKNRIYENIKGIIGQKAGGAACYLDVHEKYHGPHGLVAGTTGSGKSETLQTYMMSLAVNYSPDDIGFFIIDYKGGGMANLFDGLPHMIGQISNLSGNQVKRAMISIKSENRRRQRVFTENGVNNINAYTKLYKNGEVAIPVPHMFIIIDEFAELKREEPEFMKELISVAQVGRSLGVHLILATQKPSGTVDDNIWSNSKFKLCLRVQDKQDSNDMLHKPDAAYITQAGRCYLQVGNDEIYELFQSGYSGATYDKNAGNEKVDIAKMIRLSGKVEMTGNMAKASRKKKAQYAWLEQLCAVLEDTLEYTGTTLLGCMEDLSKREKLANRMYSNMERHDVEYAKSDYNTERLIDFIEAYYSAMVEGSTDMPTAIMKVARRDMKKLPEAKEKTQLEAVKEYLAQVAKENGYDHQMQLWMPVLPEKIYLDSFEEFAQTKFKDGVWAKPAAQWSLDFVIGKMDDPENQDQMPLEVNFATDGHIAICGSIVSGKSTMMQTMIYAMIKKYSPEMVNIYGLDFSSKMMSAFEEAPHVGGILYESDEEKIGKFFNMIVGILDERKTLFRGGNYSQYVQVNGVTLPAIVIFVDNYAAFKEKTEEQYEDIMIRLSKEGVNHGIYLVVSGAGFGMNDITNRVGENINTTLCLSLQDKYEYGDLLHNMQFDVMPEPGIKGRGLAYHGKRILEYQTALAVEADNDYQRMDLIKEQCIAMKEAWPKKCARRIPEIPEKPTWKLFEELDEYEKMVKNPYYLPVGYDSASAGVYGIPLDKTYCYQIWGGKRSGKTNMLHACLQAALKKEADIAIIDHNEDAKKDFVEYKDDVRVTYADDDQSIFAFFGALLPEFVRRNKIKQQLIQMDYEEEEIFARMSEEKPFFIIISDMTWFVPFVYSMTNDIKGFLKNVLEKGRLHNIYVISAISVDDHTNASGYDLYELFTGYQTGIHFGGKTADNRVLDFDYLPYSDQSKAEKVGVGQLPNVMDDRDTKKVVIPKVRR